MENLNVCISRWILDEKWKWKKNEFGNSILVFFSIYIDKLFISTSSKCISFYDYLNGNDLLEGVSERHLCVHKIRRKEKCWPLRVEKKLQDSTKKIGQAQNTSIGIAWMKLAARESFSNINWELLNLFRSLLMNIRELFKGCLKI